MRVFISWSGEPSRSIARALYAWIPMVVQNVEPWMSDEEITSGARWADAVAKALDTTNFGIIVVTRSNERATWLIFEAGALAKLKNARVVPLCVDLPPSDLTGPLRAWQGRQLGKEGINRLVRDISKASKSGMPRESVDKVFERLWPDLEPVLVKILMQSAVPAHIAESVYGPTKLTTEEAEYLIRKHIRPPNKSS